VRGETGFRFWRLTDKLLREVESDLALWCAAEMNTGFGELANLEQESIDRPDVAELGGPLDEVRYRELWGEWEGREREFYRACAKLVEPLGWGAVLGICGPRVRILAQLVRDAYENLTSNAIPERLQLGSIQLTGAENGNYQVTSYSPYDPLWINRSSLPVSCTILTAGRQRKPWQRFWSREMSAWISAWCVEWSTSGF
jgi:hypothetical protein